MWASAKQSEAANIFNCFPKERGKSSNLTKSLSYIGFFIVKFVMAQVSLSLENTSK